MSKIRLSGSNSGYVEIAAAADAGNLTFTMPTTGTALFGNGNNVISGITTYNAALDINSSIDVSGASVFNNDVTFDGATAGYDVVWDRSDNQLEFGDNTKLSFGASSDLQIFHDGNFNKIQATSNLLIGDSSNNLITMYPANGGVNLLYTGGHQKLATTLHGVNITGICTATSFSGDGSNLTGLNTPLSFRNKIINGDFTIHQRGGTIASSSGNYTLDRWRTYRTGDSSGGFSVQQSLSSYPQTNISGVIDNFKASAFITVTSAGSAAVNNNCKFQQRIEGSNVYDLAFGTAVAKKVTVSFYVKCSLTGDFGVALVNGAHNRSNVQTYTINNATTWERKVLTFDGDTSGSWEYGTGIGLQLMFDMGSGSDKHTSSLNTWVSGEKHGTSSSVKLIHTNGATIQFAGVQLESGDTATPFEHRSFGDELARCQRYYELIVERDEGSNAKENCIGLFWGDGSNSFTWVKFHQKKRTQPTLEISNYTNAFRFYGSGGGVNASTMSANTLHRDGMLLEQSGNAGTAGFTRVFVTNNGLKALVAASAEL